MTMIPGKAKGLKGLPKRAMNTRKAETRQRSWKRGQQRKDERRREQQHREERNVKLRAAGRPTPWEAACLSRAERRAA